MTTKPTLQKILQGILHIEDESEQTMRGWGVLKKRRKKKFQKAALILLH
jgi:hypothetical protein